MGSFRYGLTRVEIDEELLKSIAEQTGGCIFGQQTTNAWHRFMMKSTSWKKRGGGIYVYHFRGTFPYFYFTGMALLLVEWILRITVYKSIV